MDTCGFKMRFFLHHRFVPLLFLLILNCVSSVDRNNFKTCEQSGFCRRHRNLQPDSSPYQLQMNTIKVHHSRVEGHLVNSKTGVVLKLELCALVSDTLRMRINELSSVYPRYEAKEALAGDPQEASLKVTTPDDQGLTVTFGRNKAVINANPFRVDVYSGKELVISANSRGLLKFEHSRLKDQPKPNQEGDDTANDEAANAIQVDDEKEDAWWEETFKSHTDSKPRGPMSVGMDFSFIGFENVYGIPEHADSFSLRETKGSTDPYRLYNLDVFQYELNNPMALYGSVPYMLAHNEIRTVGLVWLNAAETWVDVESGTKQGVMSSIVEFVKGTTSIPEKKTHWISETGIIDTFFLLGPNSKDVMKQYAQITGTTPLPPYFALGYHQCRWNYNDQDDVRAVDAGFDEHDIPYDFIWLDIEHADGKKYFTWDPFKFPNPGDMVNNLTAKGHKMVTIIDPHIKRESGYHIHTEATDKGYYVKNKDGNDYDGWCWPGSSGYLDFVNPEVRDWWASQFAFDKYPGSSPSLFTWNDMNEPSVFNGPEVTMHKDAKHYGGWEHRDIHNIYGTLMVMSTVQGQLMRTNYQQRTFVLSRAFFIGSHRYGAVWTGDNNADWGHLRITIPMMLSLSITGFAFSGADVGGFFNNPDTELMIRWYQAGAFQPFYRAHSHIDTRRREPWLMGDEATEIIRAALRVRYSFLPLWYTLFYENDQTGVPPMRPLWMEFPTDKETFALEDEYMIGNALLVHPVVEQGATSVSVYFPGENEVWYDLETFQRFESPSTVSVPVNIRKIPYYQRGGVIVPKKERIRRSSSLTRDDPYTFVITLDKEGTSANGTLYIDDGYSFRYKNGEYIHLSLTFSKNVLSSRMIGGNGKFKTKSWLEKVVIVGIPSAASRVEISGKNLDRRDLISTYDAERQVMTIRKPAVNMGDEFDIVLYH